MIPDSIRCNIYDALYYGGRQSTQQLSADLGVPHREVIEACKHEWFVRRGYQVEIAYKQTTPTHKDCY